jgi:hypothetical protein
MTDEQFDALCEANSFGAVARGEFPTVPRGMLKALVDAAVAAEVERLRAVISNAAHKLEQQRVWGGMDWVYPAMPPRVWRAVLEQLDATLKEPTP